MPSKNFPVAVWRDHAGLVTARMLDWTGDAAVADTPRRALAQLKDSAAWWLREMHGSVESDVLEPQLSFVAATVRPEYEHGDRKFPCPETVELRMPAVTAHRRAGTLTCLLPTLGVSFDYFPGDSASRLIREFVRRHVEGLTPAEIARLLPPRDITLEILTVKHRERDNRPQEPPLQALRAVAEPIGDRAMRRRYSRAIAREEEIAALVARLRERAGVLLVGPPGVGKTAVLADAAREIERDAPEQDEASAARPRQPARFRHWITSGARLVAGMKYLGQWEQRCEVVIQELADIEGVLCIESLEGLLRAGGLEASAGLASFFVPYLERGELRLVIEATPEELDACRRLLPGFVDLFQVLEIEPMGAETAHRVLRQLADTLGRGRHIAAGDALIETVYRLFRRFLPYQQFPGRTVPFLRELYDAAARRKAGSVTVGDAIERFTLQTGLPSSLLRDDQPLLFDDVLAELQREVIGQDHACRTAAQLVTTFKSGMNDPQHPLGVLLFCGPTGVGKTQLAKTLAHYFFGHGEAKDRLVRLDMSEYSSYGAAERIFTRPDGEPSRLIQAVRSQPFVLLLLDEIEKAADEVFDVLLALFDEGRLTDRFGRTTNFTSSVIVMTSNLGGTRREPLGFAPGEASYAGEVESFFRPELFNRIDDVVVFGRLSAPALRSIAEKELRELAEREGLAKRGLRLAWSERLLDFLARAGSDVRYGARPLQRVLQQHVVAPLARWLVAHPRATGELCLALDDDGRVVVQPPGKQP